jgi:hypothetical protein
VLYNVQISLSALGIMTHKTNSGQSMPNCTLSWRSRFSVPRIPLFCSFYPICYGNEGASSVSDVDCHAIIRMLTKFADKSFPAVCMFQQSVLYVTGYKEKDKLLYSSVGIATGYGLDDQGEREFESR